jgi:hypothetical protein
MLSGWTVLLGIGTVWLAGSAAGQGHLVMFDVPEAGVTVAKSINGAGTIVGYYFSPPPNPLHGFLRDAGGTITSFDPPGSVSTHPGSANGAGAIGGSYGDSNGKVHGFVRDPSGRFTSFDPPDSSNFDVTVTGINDPGTITGWYYRGTQQWGFLRHADGSFISFAVPGSVATVPYAINVHGTIAGIYSVGNATHGFVRDREGRITYFDPPQSVAITVSGLNAGGTIVGYYTDAAGKSRGFERDASGSFTFFQDEFPSSLNEAGVTTGVSGTEGYVRKPNGEVLFIAAPPTSGCRQMSPQSINRAGVVTGVCTVNSSESHGFVWMP